MKKLKHIWKKAKQNTKIIFKSLKKYIKDTTLEDTVEKNKTDIKTTRNDRDFWENEAHKKDDKIFKLEKNIKDAKELILSMQIEELDKIMEILERK